MSSDNQGSVTRRSFIKASAGVMMVSGLGIPRTLQAGSAKGLATMIDLDRCDGCLNFDEPRCVASCRDRNLEIVPEPVSPMPILLPRGITEDWSRKKDVTDRLTPYNFICLQRADVEYQGERKTIFIPRRCMHCDNPACATICPFAANHKYENGAVVIDYDLCFGGAKCRTVCPWQIPQRQSGVGIYLKIIPTLAGNGVMYKCDLCNDLIHEGKIPACIDACPKDAMAIGPYKEIMKAAEKRADEMKGFIYGMTENGGTGTFYVSPVPFDILNEAIDKGPGKPHLGPVKRDMEAMGALEKSVVFSPVIGLAAGIAAVWAAVAKRKGDGKND
ncbi:MAG: 4Fe-4S dicluster domain-containing protein [Deltaproteobacteria bacterium]|nr:4Fe-4S dicluster domain-containing protein [Deltaproteobacteria bacterium]